MASKYKIQSRQVRFPGATGYELAATIDFPGEIEPKQYAVMSHCFTCTRQTITTARLSRGLAQAGFAVLRLDFTGLGESEGEFADSHFRSMVTDIACAADFLAKHYQPPGVLIGHSMGGTASLAASQLSQSVLSRVNSVITLASPAYPAHVLHHFGAAMPVLEQGGASEIVVAGKAYPVKPTFVEDVQSYDMTEQMEGCKQRILAIRAGNDDLVGPEAAEQILAYTQGAKQLVDIAEADHLFSDRKHAAKLETAVLDWLDV